MPTTGKTRQLIVVDGNFKTYQVYKHLLVVQTEKHLRATWETQVQSLGWEDPLEKEMALGFPDDSDGEESTCNVGDPGSIPGLERSPGEENGYPL